MRRGESEIYFTAIPRERGWWSINLDMFIMGENSTLFRICVCLLPEIGHGDKSLNVTFISGTDWFWMEKMISKTTTKKQWLQPQAGCERLDLYHRPCWRGNLLCHCFQPVFNGFLACSDIEIETHLSDMLNVLRLDIIPRNPAKASRFSFVIGASKITLTRVK